MREREREWLRDREREKERDREREIERLIDWLIDNLYFKSIAFSIWQLFFKMVDYKNEEQSHVHTYHYTWTIRY